MILKSFQLIDKKMPEINIKNLDNKRIEFTLPCETALLKLITAHVDLLHSCGGKGRCTTCKLKVWSGSENISEETHSEQNFKRLGALKADERLACQCVPLGSLEVSVPKSSQMPHLSYNF
ncbi:MAG: (2Fe-2S)-binding protein [Cytophagales bacterium]|nr:MAG: (2Fe-2S)-binding protein [Cytophagales bacterium]TAF61474.1 MAG: (2Fe-2S)-binding protein [Cytophagales bacterium]